MFSHVRIGVVWTQSRGMLYGGKSTSNLTYILQLARTSTNQEGAVHRQNWYGSKQKHCQCREELRNMPIYDRFQQILELALEC